MGHIHPSDRMPPLVTARDKDVVCIDDIVEVIDDPVIIFIRTILFYEDVVCIDDVFEVIDAPVIELIDDGIFDDAPADANGVSEEASALAAILC
uniref:Uncharacterized protein n=1 Tax=Pristionchus pacificus TaxID=54126 RepID=A0A2A6B8I8_PRIPA|eukprot:PDM62184.1 hypothetical protein PRIPAC_51626 [Pristionchus pacificus]